MTSPNNYLAVIKVVDVGGGGANAVNHMTEEGLKDVELIAVNTDSQALIFSDTDAKLDIGCEITRGLGAGANPEVDRASVEDHKDEIEKTLKGADMVFTTAGEGGGTGTGAAPAVMSIARKSGALIVGVVTKPLDFEGKYRARQTAEGIETLREVCDTPITIPNQRLLQTGEQDLSMMDVFRFADETLYNGVQGIIDLTTIPGMINVDFADVRSVMTKAGSAPMGVGSARGDDRVMNVATQAISPSPLESTMDGVQGVLVSVAGGFDLGLMKVNAAASIVEEEADPDANIIFGTIIDGSLGDEVRVTVIATGFEQGDGNPLDGPAASAAACPVAQDAEARSVAGQVPRQGSVLPGGDNLDASAPRIEEERPVAQPREHEDRDRFAPRTSPNSGGLFTDNLTPHTQENRNYRGAHRGDDRDDRRGGYQASSDLPEWGF